MNYKLSAISCQLLAIFIIFNFSFSIFNSVDAQMKSSLQVDSINMKKAIATTLPSGSSTDSLLTLMNGEVRKIPMPPSIISVDAMNAAIACAIGSFIDPRDGNTYTVKDYGGTAGCWMTQNLRYYIYGAKSNVVGTTRTLADTGITKTLMASTTTLATYSMGTGATAPSTRNISYKEHFEAMGVLYNWHTAMNDTATVTKTSYTGDSSAIGFKSIKRGICPPGWVLPSDRDWTNLEMTILQQYEVGSVDGTWLTSWETGATGGWRNPSDNSRAGTGTAMKKDIWLSTQTGTILDQNSTISSQRNISDFNIMLTGWVSNNNITSTSFGTDTYIWSSTPSNVSSTWRRNFSQNKAGINRDAGSIKLDYFPIRCKKN